MIDKLNEISKKLDLWNIAKTNAMQWIENEGLDEIRQDPKFSKVVLSDIEFIKKKQSLIFWNCELGKTYILRTEYVLKITNGSEDTEGYYSYDIDENGDFFEEWLGFK